MVFRLTSEVPAWHGVQDQSADLEIRLAGVTAAVKDSRAAEEASAAEVRQLQETERRLEAQTHALERAGADAIAQRNAASTEAEEARTQNGEAGNKLAKASSRAEAAEQKLAAAEQTATEAQAAAEAAFAAAGGDLAAVSGKLAEASVERDEALRQTQESKAAMAELQQQLQA